METIRRHTRPPARFAIASVLGALVLGGCGAEERYANRDRPAAPIGVSAVISTDSVVVSPRSFGAGPISMLIANQTEAPQVVTFESAGNGTGFRQQTAPINPGDTATISVSVPTGRAVVQVQGDTIASANVSVGAPRPTAQDRLLQP